MNKEKQKKLVNILVICLYFLWPYLLNGIINLFNLSQNLTLYISFSVNFLFLFIIILIYKKTFQNYINKLNKNFKKNLFNSIKIFLIGLGIYILFNTVYEIIGIPSLSNHNSMLSMFKKVPIMFILNTLFYYPVIEEIVFKMTLKDIIKNKWIFVIFTGLFITFFQVVFSINTTTDLLDILPNIALACSLSYIYYETDNIVYPILIRMCYNLIPCIIYIVDLFI